MDINKKDRAFIFDIIYENCTEKYISQIKATTLEKIKRLNFHLVSKSDSKQGEMYRIVGLRNSDRGKSS